MELERQRRFLRVFFYVLGMVLLAFGISLNKKTGLGVSPIVSVAYCVSQIGGFNFGNATFGLYALFVLVEVLAHLWICRRMQLTRGRTRRVVFLDILQVPVCLVFTRGLNLFEALLPEFAEDFAGSFWGGYAGRILVLVLAIAAIGVGAALTLDVKLVPNPGDGIVQALADLAKKETGFMKNCFDFGCISVTAVLSLTMVGGLVGLGLGTVLAMIGVGRTIAIYHRIVGNRITNLSEVKAK